MPLADRPALLLSSLIVVLGLQLFALGLLGELIIFTHARNIKDDAEVISFGIFDIDRDSLHVVRGSEEEELKRQEEIAKYVHDTPLEGIYEVVEEIRT